MAKRLRQQYVKARESSERRDRTQPRRVNIWTNDEDWDCVWLANMGLTTWAIAQRTGLTHSQVTYRLGVVGHERVLYRQGKSMLAKIIMDSPTVKLEGKRQRYRVAGERGEARKHLRER